MKTIVLGLIAAAGVMALSAGSASAASDWKCKQYARDTANAYVNPGSSIAGGAAAGAATGGILSAITKGNVATGLIAGAATGAFLGAATQDSRWRGVYERAYWDCRNGPGPQPIYDDPDYGYPPPPGSQAWYQACAAKYKSFKWDGPYAGYYLSKSSGWRPCQL